jgi:GR25 family glycosyltransferase involved in LPS biosynthesis
LPPVETCEYPDSVSMEPGGKLTPGHYGCYLGHKSAFYKGIQSDSDYILIFECDCVIDIDMGEFIKKVDLACDILNRTDLLMFSLGFHNNVHIIEKNEDYWVVNKFYGAHAYLIPRKSFDIIKNMYENNKWNVTDLLFVEKLDQYKTGIFETPITKQSAGYSILDKIYNDDRH